MARSLYIIDGHSQIYRAYYAPFRSLTSPTGEPTRATYVFTQMLLNLIRDRRPDYLLVTLDADESKLDRKKIYPEYKAHRPAPPEDLAPQERRILNILEAAGIPILSRTGHEADDLIASIIEQLGPDRPRGPNGGGADLEICIVSRDKDLDQLLRPGVCMYDPLKDETITADNLYQIKGWHPHQAIDAQLLIGDTVDNVPGVPGIGAKTAARLLQKYGTAAAILEHASELTPSLRKNLLEFAPRMEMVRQLVTLRRNLAVDFDLNAAATSRFQWQRVRPILSALGFRRLIEQLPAGESTEAVREAAEEAATEPQQPVTERANAPAQPTPHRAPSTAIDRLRVPDGGDYRLINEPAALAEFAARLAAQPEFAVDTETTGTNPVDAELVGLSFAWEVGRAYYLPVKCVYGGCLPLAEVRSRLGPILADKSKRKVGQNLKYDLIVLQQAGMPVEGPLFDTMIASFVVDPARSSNSLDSLAFQLLGHTMIPISDLIGSTRPQLRIDQVPLARVATYAGEDADYTWRLRLLLEPQLADLGLEKLFHDVEMPLVSVLTAMEMNGVCIDVEFLAQMGRQMAKRTEALATEVHHLAGQVFNLDSPKQLAEVLFDKLGHRVVRQTKTLRSTDAETLEILARETNAPVFTLLLEYRELQKLRGTYVDALPAARSPRTGRIHTSYHQTGAVTGRLSSSEPNLQNIPIRTELGRQIRKAFVPRSREDVLLVADYSQVELRILAHFSRDQALSQAFAEDQDIHAFVAAQVNGVPVSEVTREMRGRAKAVNFGIVYGQTAFGLSQATGMSRGEAQAFIDAYFQRYPRVRQFIADTIAGAKRDGCVRTILGRWRPIENIDSRNSAVRAQAERFAVNTVIQGSAADLIKVAMIRLHRRIESERLPLRLLLQVHDELVCEGPRAQAQALADVIRAEMTGAMTLHVPLKADVAWGDNWLEAK